MFRAAEGSVSGCTCHTMCRERLMFLSSTCFKAASRLMQTEKPGKGRLTNKRGRTHCSSVHIYAGGIPQTGTDSESCVWTWVSHYFYFIYFVLLRNSISLWCRDSGSRSESIPLPSPLPRRPPHHGESVCRGAAWPASVALPVRRKGIKNVASEGSQEGRMGARRRALFVLNALPPEPGSVWERDDLWCFVYHWPWSLLWNTIGWK